MNKEQMTETEFSSKSHSEVQKGTDYRSSVRSRAVKLSSAIHLVTGLVSESEPIRLELRRAAVDMVSLITGVNGKSYTESAELFKKTKQIVERATALLDVAGTSNVVSPMNADLLKKELEKFSVEIEDEKNAVFENGLFPLEMLLENKNTPAIERPRPSSPKGLSLRGEEAELPQGRSATARGGVEGFFSRKKPVTEATGKGETLDNVNTESKSPFVSFKSSSDEISQPEIKETKNSRRDLIVEAVRNKGEVSLSDMKNLIKDVSDKTLQRELVSLVENGTLKRSGDRRWTKYSINGVVS